MANGKKWSESEAQLLVEKYEPKKQIILKLARKLQRAPKSVASKAYEMGLCRQERVTTRRPWNKEEVDLLYKYAGQIPTHKLYAKINALCNQKGWSKRTKNAIDLKIVKLSLKRSIDGYNDE